MIKNLKKFIKKNTALSVVILLALVIGLPTLAVNSFDERVIDRIADRYLEGTKEVALGAITQDKSRFDHGIEILAEGLDITGGDLDVDVSSDFSAAVTMSGANSITGSTTIPLIDTSIQEAFDWSNGTSSPGYETVKMVIAEYENTGADKFCSATLVDLSTGRSASSGAGYGATMAVGTTTRAGDDSLTNTTTATLIAGQKLASTTAAFYNKEDDTGTNPEEQWSFPHGDIIVVSEEWDATTGNATSGNTWTAAGGFTGVGKLHVSCTNRY